MIFHGWSLDAHILQGLHISQIAKPTHVEPNKLGWFLLMIIGTPLVLTPCYDSPDFAAISNQPHFQGSLSRCLRAQQDLVYFRHRKAAFRYPEGVRTADIYRCMPGNSLAAQPGSET